MSNDLYKTHLLNGLKSINSNYEYIIEWDTFFLEKENKNPLKEGKKRLLILLTEMPSVVYSEGMTLSIMMELFCDMENTREVFDILKKYQVLRYNQKNYSNNKLINENYYSPSIAENYVQIDNKYKVRIMMQGNCSITNNVVDISELKFDNQATKFLLFHDGLVAENTALTILNSNVKKTINNTGLYTLEVKLINTNNNICTKARKFKYGENEANTSVSVSIKYTDNTTYTKTMIFTSVDFQVEQNGNIPTIVVQLREKVGV